MSRAGLALLAVLALSLVGAAVAGAAPAPAAGTAVEVDLELDANQGLRAHLESSDGEVELKLFRRGRRVSYKVRGEATEAGLKVRFGKLGLVDVAFQPTRTVHVNEPPVDCKGAPHVRSEGVFTGTIEFEGERDFVRIAATRAEGRMLVLPEWQCRRRGPIRFRAAPRGVEDPAEVALLGVASRRCTCGFAALAARDRRGRGTTVFYGVTRERREGMEIERITFGHAAPASFVFDHAAGTATVRPPLPFSGHGSFTRLPHRRDRWQSTIRVPLLGAAPLSVRGPAFRAQLRSRFSTE